MPRRRLDARRTGARKSRLLRFPKARLAEMLVEQIGMLPYGVQQRWDVRHLPAAARGRSASASRPDTLLNDIEEFGEQSRSACFVSWVADDPWDSEDAAGVDDGLFQEWTARFTDLMTGGLALTRAGRHGAAVRAYRLLLDLLRAADETTDILGNHGAPQDSMRLDFGAVVKAYTQSLRAGRPKRPVDEVITEMLPVAKKFWYRGGYAGLAGGLDAGGREQLKARLITTIEAEMKTNRFGCPDEVHGLIALAECDNNQAEVLALKERYASRNAVYLRDVLTSYEQQKDWKNVARLAQLGVRRFGHHGDLAETLIKTHDALGDRAAAQETLIAHFLEEPQPAEFVKLKRRSEALHNWDQVLQTLLRASESRARTRWASAGLTARLLLTEGREREALDRVAARRGRLEFEDLKFLAKYAVARLSAGADLAPFKKLSELQTRLTREREEPYGWLRLIVRQPPALSQGEYARLAVDMYGQLVELHLTSGKPSRAAPAAHYCAVVAEISRLLDAPELWADLLLHLKQHHGRRRLIWEHLRTEGCLPV